MICGLRPEDLSAVKPGEGTLTFEVGVIEPTGAETMVIGRAADTPMTAIFRERRDLVPGEKLHLRPAIMHLFDSETGRRIGS